uniref:Uncharacterized protein n=1 Tax=Rhizophora mucronata TaxID=61149 RepID=A0A2P2QKG1_RHIMU
MHLFSLKNDEQWFPKEKKLSVGS